MKIISHRGFWKKENEKNSIQAFKRAFNYGFGIETDIRDQNGMLVISHDLPSKKCIKLENVLKLYNRSDKKSVLALNVKADGLQQKAKYLLTRYKIRDYFFFDMSIPDALGYKKYDLNFFTRMSEHEPQPLLYNVARGIWLDEFHYHWIDINLIKRFKRKKMCLVSPELHNRPYFKIWQAYKEIEKKVKTKNLMLCTDFPQEAMEFFNEKN